jgi:hypothetical protein
MSDFDWVLLTVLLLVVWMLHCRITALERKDRD